MVKHGIFFIFFLLLLASFGLDSHAQDPHTDSLITEIGRLEGDTALFKSLSEDIYNKLYNHPEQAIQYARKGSELARKYKYYEMAARMTMFVGIVHDLKGNFDSAFVLYENGLEICRAHSLKNAEADIYNNYSITLAVSGRFNESVEYALKALDIFETSGDSASLAKIYNNLGARYSDMEQSDKALHYYLKAAAINEARNDSYRLAHNYGNIGLLYYDENEDEKALEYFSRSLQLQDTLNNKMDHSIALHNLALAYNRLAKYDLALTHESRALELSTELKDELGRLSSLTGLSAIYHEMGDAKKSLSYLKEAEEVAINHGARYYLINIYEKMATLYAEIKNYEEAFEYNIKYGELKDSILTVEKDQALGKIDDYESKKQEQEIQLLTLDSELQRTEMKRQKILRNSIAVTGILILVLSVGLLHRYRYVRKTRNELAVKNEVINKEKERSDELLLNILPEQTAKELKAKGSSQARHFDRVTVMFTDFKGFTSMAEKMTPQELVDEIDTCFKSFDEIVSKHNVEKIKTIGDAYMCAGGLPVANTTNPVDVLRAALEIREYMESLKATRIRENRPYFELRIGIHTGAVVAGIVGIRKFQYDIWGDTVNLASRMESSGEVGKINISQSTYEQVQHRFDCIHRGKITAKGKGEVDMYFVVGEATT